MTKRKLGYTWYPKDWTNSDGVFELNLAERGLYRELIDISMLNDNKATVKLDIWSRRFGSELDELNSILNKLINLGLIEIQDDNLFIPSCEERLVLSRSGREGGKKSKPLGKPLGKPLVKPLGNQKKEKEKRKEKKAIPSFDEFKEYALLKKKDVCLTDLNLKYESWVENDWRIGGSKPRDIVNWKSTLLNTLPYLKTVNIKEEVKAIPHWNEKF